MEKKTLSYIRRNVLVIKIEKFQSDNGETLGTSIFSLFLFFFFCKENYKTNVESQGFHKIFREFLYQRDSK